MRKRALCVWPRRHGKDLFAINLVADSIFERVGTYWHVFPEYKQGRAAMWDGMTFDGRKFLDYFPKEIIKRRYENDMRIHFMHPENPDEEGSVYRIVGADNYNALVGTNPIGVILSEYALQDPAAWQYITPILAENKGWALFISTVRGHNHLYKLFKDVRNNKEWFVEELSSRTTRRDDGSPVITDEIIQQARDEGIPEEIIQQEYYSNWDAPLVGAYYSPQMDKALAEKRIRPVPIDPRIGVSTAWDIGRDSTAIIFYQEIGQYIHIIDCYARSGESMPHFVTVLKERGYTYNAHYLPWDIEFQEWGGGKTRKESFKLALVGHEMKGARVITTPFHEREDGIEQCRNLFPSIVFDNERGQMSTDSGLIESLKSYQKQWDERLKVFRSQPLHNWASHFADAFRYLCWNIKYRTGLRDKTKGPPREAVDDFHYV